MPDPLEIEAAETEMRRLYLCNGSPVSDLLFDAEFAELARLAIDGAERWRKDYLKPSLRRVKDGQR